MVKKYSKMMLCCFFLLILIFSCKKNNSSPKLNEDALVSAQATGFVRYYNNIYDPIVKSLIYDVYSKPDVYFSLSSEYLDSALPRAVVLDVDDTVLSTKKELVDLFMTMPVTSENGLFIEDSQKKLIINGKRFKKDVSSSYSDLLPIIPVKKLCKSILSDHSDITVFFISSRWGGNNEVNYNENIISNLEESVFEKPDIVEALEISSNNKFAIKKESLTEAINNGKRFLLVTEKDPLEFSEDHRFKAEIRQSIRELGFNIVLTIGDESSDFEPENGNYYYERKVILPNLFKKFQDAYKSLYGLK